MNATVHVIFNISYEKANIFRKLLADKEVSSKVKTLVTVIPMTTPNTVTHYDYEPVMESWLMIATGHSDYVDTLVNSLYYLGIEEVLVRVEA